MFKLVAVLFLVVNGSPSDQVAGTLTYNQAIFPTLETCKAFSKDEASAAARKTIQEIVNSKQGEIVAKLGCKQVEDNTI